MHRLYHGPESSRWDLVVHLSLGLAAVAAVLLALGTTFDFCHHLDPIAAWFSNDADSAVVSGQGHADTNALTNADDAKVPLPDPGQPSRTNPPAGAPRAGGIAGSPISG